MNDYPTLLMLCGLPASGKSTFAEDQRRYSGYVVCSSDKLREEMFGDINDQTHNSEVFEELHRRIRKNLLDGKDVIYDATNLVSKRRRHFLDDVLYGIKCQKIIKIFALAYETCLRRNWERERKVPDEVMKRMYMTFQPPYYFEGWDKISVYSISDDDIYMNPFMFYKYDQNNYHHTLTLGKHMMATEDYLKSKTTDKNLILAGSLHDCGKPFCRETDENGVSHYLNHENVRAYDLLSRYQKDIEVSALVAYHMLLFNIDNIPDKKRILSKWEKKFGKEFLDKLMLLHEADIAAH